MTTGIFFHRCSRRITDETETLLRSTDNSSISFVSSNQDWKTAHRNKSKMNDYALYSVLLYISIYGYIYIYMLVTVRHCSSFLVCSTFFFNSLCSVMLRGFIACSMSLTPWFSFVVTMLFINIVARIGGLGRFICIPLLVFARRRFHFCFFRHDESVKFFCVTLFLLAFLSWQHVLSIQQRRLDDWENETSFTFILLFDFAHRRFQFRFFRHVEVVQSCLSTLFFLTLLSWQPILSI